MCYVFRAAEWDNRIVFQIYYCDNIPKLYFHFALFLFSTFRKHLASSWIQSGNILQSKICTNLWYNLNKSCVFRIPRSSRASKLNLLCSLNGTVSLLFTTFLEYKTVYYDYTCMIVNTRRKGGLSVGIRIH